MKKILIKAWFTVVLLLLASKITVSQENFKTLDNIAVDGNVVIISLSGQTKYNAFNVSNPPKMVIEFTDTEHNWKQKEMEVNKGIIRRIRSGQFKNEPVKVARVVIDLSRIVEYEIKSEGNNVKIYLNPKEDKPEAKAPPAEKKDPVLQAVPLALAPVPAPVVKEDPKPVQVAAVPAVVEKPVKTEAVDTKPQPEKTEPAIQKPPVAAPVAVVPKKVRPKHIKKEVPEIVQKTENTEKPVNKPIKRNRFKKQEAAATEKGMVNIPKTLVTLDFEDADIRDVLRVLSMKSGINIIFSDDVKGNVTLHLENVPFDKAYDTIMSLSGLVSHEQGPNILRVVTPQKVSEERSMAVTFTKVFPLNYAKAEDVKANLDSVRSAEGRKGSISVDARTNSLVVTDTPEGLTSVERLIAELDKKPQQVLIEAKIVEMSLTDSQDIGIQWQYAGTPVNNSNTRVDVGRSGAAAGTASLGTDSSGLVQKDVANISAGGTGVNFPAAPAAGQAGSIAFGIIANNNYLSGVLTALSQKGLSKILSTPRVTTINNQEAKILVGQKIPYTSAQTQSAIGQTTSTQFLDVGIKLTVTPTVNADNKITLVVHPEVSLFVRADPSGPVLGNREAQTTVLVENGETIVIGGLITEEDQKLGTQVPLLGDLPIIGHLFRRDFKSKDRTELLVFITPKILD